jgi:hypothetical protein
VQVADEAPPLPGGGRKAHSREPPLGDAPRIGVPRGSRPRAPLIATIRSHRG